MLPLFSYQDDCGICPFLVLGEAMEGRDQEVLEHIMSYALLRIATVTGHRPGVDYTRGVFILPIGVEISWEAVCAITDEELRRIAKGK
jgi:hypothetical protein